VKAQTPAPGQVLLFSGHRVDAPGRPVPRFPPAHVPAAAAAIGAVLDRAGAGPGDLALTQGAAGGDILFAEACLARGLTLELWLPVPEPAFEQTSILPSSDGPAWLVRWRALRQRAALGPREIPAEEPAEELAEEPAEGPATEGGDPFERCNAWLLARALSFGPGRLCFICLWDGGGADGPGGTAHMVQQVRQHGAQLRWIDARRLHP
jgi:hypothetical protein